MLKTPVAEELIFNIFEYCKSIQSSALRVSWARTLVASARMGLKQFCSKKPSLARMLLLLKNRSEFRVTLVPLVWFCPCARHYIALRIFRSKMFLIHTLGTNTNWASMSMTKASSESG